MRLRILLLSAYDAMSHKIWRTRLAQMLPEHEWTQLALPPRHFNWRIRGNSLQWALLEHDCLSREYDLLIATSMVDLSSLRGFLPALAALPTVVYFHENQFDYPAGSLQRASNVEPQLVPLYAAACADATVFNSHYNRSTFLQGCRELFNRLPDRLPDSLLQRLEQSEVIAVPLGAEGAKGANAATASTEPKPVLDVVWNHRWEYDKGTQSLLLLAQQIEQQCLPIRLHVLGQQFRNSPQEFTAMEALLDRHAEKAAMERGYFGFIEDREEYERLISRCDVVLSTAQHDFQGLAVQEACVLGCTPLAPNRLVYPEYIAEQCLYESAEQDGDAKSGAALLDRLKLWQQQRSEGIALPKADLSAFSHASLRPQYAEIFERVSTGNGSQLPTRPVLAGET